MSLPDESPLFIPEPADEPLLGTSRARANRARKGDMTAVWIILGLAGLCGVGYAIHLALDTSPAQPVAPTNTAVVAPASPTTTDDNFGEDTVRLEALRHRLNERRNRAEVPVHEAEVPKIEPPVEVVVEPERPAPPPETPAAFDNGAAFDRPAVDSSRMPRRRGSGDFGAYQAPVTRDRAPNSDRPNQPDPSFDAPPAGRPMMKKGARR